MFHLSFEAKRSEGPVECQMLISKSPAQYRKIEESTTVDDSVVGIATGEADESRARIFWLDSQLRFELVRLTSIFPHHHRPACVFALRFAIFQSQPAEVKRSVEADNHGSRTQRFPEFTVYKLTSRLDANALGAT